MPTLMRFEEYTGSEVDNPNAKLAKLNPFRYRSYYYDSETNLYYLNSRYYDPELGRFINADDINCVEEYKFNGLNIYSYCLNNPIKYFDPNGYSILFLALLLLTTTIIGATFAGLKAHSEGKQGWELAKSILVGGAIGLAIGGVFAMTGGMGAALLSGTGATFFGATALQAFAMGALAFNTSAFLIMPIVGIKMQGIEYQQTMPYEPPYKAPTSQLYNFNLKQVSNSFNIYRRLQLQIFSQKGDLNDFRILWRSISKM